MLPEKSILLPYTYGTSAGFRRYSSGKGVYLYTSDNREVLDGLAGSMNANLGHGNVTIAATMHSQALGLTSLPSIAGDVTDDSIMLADRLCRLLGTMNSAWTFTSSGSEATESALAIVWKHWSVAGRPSKKKILSLDGSYHGCTLGALAITGRLDEHTDTPSLTADLRLALPAWDTQNPSRVSDALEQMLTSQDPEEIAAIFIEPVMGLAGMIPASGDDIRRVVDICRCNDILVVLDEALTGLGRTGHLTAADHYRIDHDLLLISKGLGCGFIPIAATCIGPRIAAALQSSRPTLRHGHTASGNPLAARVAATVLDELSVRDAVDNARRMENVFRQQVSAGLARLRLQYQLRGLGLCLALETEHPAHAEQVKNIAFGLGLRIRAIDQNIIICPPLTISTSEMSQLTARLCNALATAEHQSDFSRGRTA